ncbi:MAG: hypothetical protein K2M94_07295 [Paramuribaculum sp.]|nr:hypothetical protein [Paramuribaculum sp.]
MTLHNIFRIFRPVKAATLLLAGLFFTPSAHGETEVPVFIIIGQSNADGSAFFNEKEDARLHSWYNSDRNHHKIKIWYKSSRVENISSNALGEAARHVVDGTVTDVTPGWLDLWYRNENTLGRTAMTMIHGYGTYSTGDSTDCAQGRRGMEGEFGMRFAERFPDEELYIIKLGVSGSFISSWINPLDDTNWKYFLDKIFKPAIDSLLSEGKRPVLTGIWWMQGCADSARDSEYYGHWLRKLIERCRNELGFPDGKFYIGHILKPGESEKYPSGSVAYGQGVRDAQDAVAADMSNVEIIDVSDVTMQYEPNFSGYIHFDHAGQNTLGDILAGKVIAGYNDDRVKFTTPGTWNDADGIITYVPSVGEPQITYSTCGNNVKAILKYPGWTEIKTYKSR